MKKRWWILIVVGIIVLAILIGIYSTFRCGGDDDCGLPIIQDSFGCEQPSKPIPECSLDKEYIEEYLGDLFVASGIYYNNESSEWCIDIFMEVHC